MKPKPLAFLPNQHGYTFTGITKDNEQIRCKIVKDEKTGLHYIYTLDDVPAYAMLKAWL